MGERGLTGARMVVCGVCVCVYVCACVRACVRACVGGCACVRACMRERSRSRSEKRIPFAVIKLCERKHLSSYANESIYQVMRTKAFEVFLLYVISMTIKP